MFNRSIISRSHDGVVRELKKVTEGVVLVIYEQDRPMTAQPQMRLIERATDLLETFTRMQHELLPVLAPEGTDRVEVRLQHAAEYEGGIICITDDEQMVIPLVTD